MGLRDRVRALDRRLLPASVAEPDDPDAQLPVWMTVIVVVTILMGIAAPIYLFARNDPSIAAQRRGADPASVAFPCALPPEAAVGAALGEPVGAGFRGTEGVVLVTSSWRDANGGAYVTVVCSGLVGRDLEKARLTVTDGADHVIGGDVTVAVLGSSDVTRQARFVHRNAVVTLRIARPANDEQIRTLVDAWLAEVDQLCAQPEVSCAPSA